LTSQADAQATFRAVQGTVYLRIHLEDVRELVGGNADARVLDGNHRIAALPLGGQPDAAPTLGILGGVVQQVHEDLGQPGQVRFEWDRVGRENDDEFVAEPFDERPARLDRPCTTVAKATRSLRSSNLPRAIRLMSSRSLMRFVMSCIWRSITPLAHSNLARAGL